MKLVEQIFPNEHNNTFKTRYIKYRAGRLKHQYWLWNRKCNNKFLDSYDAKILANCQAGKTAFFSSAGYYLKDIWPDIDSIETHSVVKEFYPDVILVRNRAALSSDVIHHYDNFAVVNNRGDHWVSVDGLTEHLSHYCKILNPGARVFYSFRDTQIHYNRLKINAEEYFLQWARSLTCLGLNLVWSEIQFPKKIKDGNQNWDMTENPDPVNGNIKFMFTFGGESWKVV